MSAPRCAICGYCLRYRPTVGWVPCDCSQPKVGAQPEQPPPLGDMAADFSGHNIEPGDRYGRAPMQPATVVLRGSALG